VCPADARSGEVTVRDLLSSLTALQGLSMVMTDSKDDEEILGLAVSALRSLTLDCRAEAVWLDGDWRPVGSLQSPVDHADGLESQLKQLGSAGGALRVSVDGWLWAFPLTSRGGASGYLLVRSKQPPPEHEWSLIQVLAQQTGVALANARLLARERATREQIADEQAALRRVATLVAHAARPEDVFTAVAAEAGRSRDADLAIMSRFDEEGGAVVVGAWAAAGSAPAQLVGSRLKDADGSLHSTMFRTGHPARTSDFPAALGLADALGGHGLQSAVGVPIRIEGRLWGMIALASSRDEPMPSDTEAWLAAFTELVATAIANADARRELYRQADEQMALRRVATLVANGAPPEDLFGAAAAEVGRVLDVDVAALIRYDPNDTITVVGAWTSTGEPPPTQVGARLPLGGRNLTTIVRETGRPARINYDDVSGAIGVAARTDWRLRVALGVPIFVNGRPWGTMNVAFTRDGMLPSDAEARLFAFTELVATAVANAQARVELRGYGEEQAALHRVATLVARATAPEEVFAAVVAEVGQVVGADTTSLSRYDTDDAYTRVGVWSRTDGPSVQVGARVNLTPENVATLVHQTSRPARVDHPGDPSDPATQLAQTLGVRSMVGVPISVEGRLWGVMTVGSRRAEPLPPETEAQLAAFTELVATAIANAETRLELRAFAEEQAALSRVATLVAGAAEPDEVFAAVAGEVGRLLDVDYTVLSRYDADGLVTVVGGWVSQDPGRPLAVGLRLKPDGHNVHAMVAESGRSARIDDYAAATGAFADAARDWQFHGSVGAPIWVEGRMWGVISAASRTASLPPGTEDRLDGFTHLVATAIANAQTRTALAASRARVVAAGDAALRRIERDLHDGAQQRLVSLMLRLAGPLRAAMPADAGEVAEQLDDVTAELQEVHQELRELARGLHPTVLTEGGLPAALKALARRSAVPVELDVRLPERLPEPTELGAYYVVAESLTNAYKHANATAVDVTASATENRLVVTIRDDGCGGAEVGGGSGLVGLKDRVEALGGQLAVTSPADKGTTIEAVLPFADAGEHTAPLVR
jgi:GAF domain-containing protein